MSLERNVAKIRFWYHANRLDINNALNQLHLMSDRKNEESNRKHVMIIFSDILPRLGYDVSSLQEESE